MNSLVDVRNKFFISMKFIEFLIDSLMIISPLQCF